MSGPAPGVNPTPHRKRPLEERESIRWVDTAQRAKHVLISAAMVTVVDDREADIYPKWAVLPEPNFHLLTRAPAFARAGMSDRKLAGPRVRPRAGPRTGSGTLFNAAG